MLYWLIFTACFCVSIKGQSTPPDMLEAIANITQGVTFVGVSGTGGDQVLWGTNTVPVFIGKQPHNLLSIAKYGQGRVAIFSKKDYLDQLQSDWTTGANRVLYENLLYWLNQVPKGEVPVIPTVNNAVDLVPGSINGITYTMNGNDVDAFGDFVYQGGVVIVADTPWARMSSSVPMDEVVYQPLLWKFGLTYTNKYFTVESNGGAVPVSSNNISYFHLGQALDVLSNDITNVQAYYKTVATLSHLSYQIWNAMKPTGILDTIWTNLQPHIANIAPRPDRIVSTEPSLSLIKTANHIVATGVVEGAVMPEVNEYPGDYSSAPSPQCSEIELRSYQRDIHVTGLHVRAGWTLGVTVISTDTQAKDWTIRIGAQKDNLFSKTSLKRWPLLVYQTTLRDTMQISTAVGGTIYFDSPSSQATIRIRLQNVVVAPVFTMRDPSIVDWLDSRNNPGLWMDLVGHHIIFTFPSDSVRAEDDPAEALDWWDSSVEAQHHLRGSDVLYTRREWFVPDDQPSAGYMHAGYPIVTHMDVVDPSQSDRFLLNVELLKESGNYWGPFHEVGHNMQRSWWTFSGTGEVTNNVFAMYCEEKIADKIGWIVDTKFGQQLHQVQAYFENGPTFEIWKSNPWVALGIYAQFAHHLGWGCFQSVFREYESLPENERPTEDQDKIDQWVIRFSRTAGFDLRPMFDFWAITYTNSVVQPEVETMTAYIPEDEITAFDADRATQACSNYPDCTRLALGPVCLEMPIAGPGPPELDNLYLSDFDLYSCAKEGKGKPHPARPADKNNSPTPTPLPKVNAGRNKDAKKDAERPLPKKLASLFKLPHKKADHVHVPAWKKEHIDIDYSDPKFCGGIIN